MNDLISVIVPIYKVEKYLMQCVESIVKQTHRNLEIILVDDGSPDHCPEMCDRWAAHDSRIKVIHKKNGGLSDARNAGLLVAKGEYVGFVDGDDWIHPDMYRELYFQMMKYDADISACGVEMVWESSEKNKMLTNSGTYILDNKEAMLAIIQESNLKQPVWYKLYRREQIQDIFFAVGKTHEDVFWSYQAIGKAKRVVVFDDAFYYYRQREESIMGSKYSLKRLDSLEAKQLRQSYIHNNYPMYESKAKADLFFSCVYHQQLAIKYLDDIELNTATKKIEKIYKADMFEIRDLFCLSIKQIVWILLLKFSFINVCKLRNKYNIGV